MDVPVLTAYPAAADEVGRDAHEPAIGIVVGRTGLAPDVRSEMISVAQPAARTALNDGTQHVNHLIGADFRDDLGHQRLELCDDIPMAVFNLRDEERRTADSAIGEGGIGTGHLADGYFAWPETEHGACVLVYVWIVQTEVVQDIDKL